MSSPVTFEACKEQGRYEEASPGEVCTLETAKRYGIADTNGNLLPSYSDVRQYISANETASRSVCLQNTDASKAYRHCVLEHGIGFVRKSTEPEKCVTVGCPPKWEERRGKCIKPLEDYMISKRAHCDERWYDWFVIPNYHLGNKMYEEKPGYCYNPCPAYHVPAYGTDPVDGESAGATATDKQNACANKNDYMGGKYAETSDYCPLVWIKRLSSTPDILKADMTAEMEKLIQQVGGESNLNEHGQYLLNQINTQADSIYKTTNRTIENVGYYGNDKMVQACRSLATPERLQQAYDVCKSLKDDPEGFVQRYKNVGDADEIIDKKVGALQQACNAVFCDPLEDAAQTIGKDPVCFENPPRIDGTEIKPKDPYDFSDQPPITSDPGKRKVGTAFTVGYQIILFCVFTVLAIFFIVWARRTIYPMIRCALMKVLSFIGIVKGYNCGLHNELDTSSYRLDDINTAMMKKLKGAKTATL